MENNGHTANDFRVGRTDCGKSGNDVGMLLPHQVYYGTTYSINESEISIPNGYKHQINRPAEVDAVGLKGIGIKCRNAGEFYN